MRFEKNLNIKSVLFRTRGNPKIVQLDFPYWTSSKNHTFTSFFFSFHLISSRDSRHYTRIPRITEPQSCRWKATSRQRNEQGVAPPQLVGGRGDSCGLSPNPANMWMSSFFQNPSARAACRTNFDSASRSIWIPSALAASPPPRSRTANHVQIQPID